MNEIKERIISSVEELLKEKPITKISVLEISKMCNINRNSFYYYFKTISDVASEIINREVIFKVEKYILNDDWFEGMNLLRELLFNKKVLILNYFHNDRATFIRNVSTQLERILDGYLRIQAEGIKLEEKDIKIATMIYKNTFLGYFIDWLDADMSEAFIESLSGVFEILNGSTRGLFVKVEQSRKINKRIMEKGEIR